MGNVRNRPRPSGQALMRLRSRSLAAHAVRECVFHPAKGTRAAALRHARRVCYCSCGACCRRGAASAAATAVVPTAGPASRMQEGGLERPRRMSGACCCVVTAPRCCCSAG
eukprot:365994-Chlamydomonas_euryale.AAC.18